MQVREGVENLQQNLEKREEGLEGVEGVKKEEKGEEVATKDQHGRHQEVRLSQESKV